MPPLRALLILLAAASIPAAACSSNGGEGTPAASPSGEPTVPVSASPITANDLLAGRATFYGAQPGDTAAGIVAGDFNGDDALDVVLGASQADGPDDSRTDGGEAYVFLGPFAPGDERDAGQGQQALTVYGANSGDQLARDMAAGDVNGDGIDDIILGAPFGDGPADDRADAGEAHVLFGSAALGQGPGSLDLAQQRADVTIYGADAQDLAGFTLLAANLNGDQIDEIIMGALWGDGPGDSRSLAGEAYVFFGSSGLQGALDLGQTRPDVTVYGAEADDRLSEELGAGDIDGDGIDDLILSAPFASGPGNSRSALGETYVIIGPPPALVDIAQDVPYLTVYGVDQGDQLGHSLGSGDVDGDGADDLLLAAVSSEGLENAAALAGEAALVPGDGGPGRIADVAAGDATTLIYSGSAGDRLGRSAAMGDLNGDGSADLLLGAPGGDGAGERRTNVGEIWIILGSPSLDELYRLGLGEADAVIEGLGVDDTLASEAFGRPVLRVVDVNGDGSGDILAGAPRGDGAAKERPDAGEAYILFVGEPR